LRAILFPSSQIAGAWIGEPRKLEVMREQLNSLEPDHTAAAELQRRVETLHQDVAAAEAVAAESRARAARRQVLEAQAAAEAAQHAQVETEAANLRADIEAGSGWSRSHRSGPRR